MQSKYNKSWRNNSKSRKNFNSQRDRARRSAVSRNSYRSSTSPRKTRKNKPLWKAFLFHPKTVKFLAVLILVGIVFSIGSVAWMSRGLPEPGKLLDREVAQSTKILDRTGETVLYEIHGDEQRTLVELNEIPDYVKWATIAIEDKDFYEHGGISLWGIFRGAIWRPLTGRRAQGGSTLTQQLVKNAILTPERTVTRKIKEWIMAYKMEKEYSKEEILQMYFNEIPYGSTAYGVEAAAQKYFGKSVRDINIAEAAVLAALPQAPTRYSPYGPNKNILLDRKDYIISLMAEQGYITEEQAEEAKNFELEFNEIAADIKAPHFVMYVKQILAEKYGEKKIEQEGLRIYTTLDAYKQEIAEEVVAEQVEKNEANHNAENGSLVAIDPKTGQVLAMVGSRDYFDEDIDGQFNVATALRQPGSSIKPLVYASAFERGYTANTILYDVLTNFSPSEDPEDSYEPHNYDLAEHGPVTIRKALAGSLNIPAVKALYLAGIENVLERAGEFGYTSLSDRDRFGLSLVLGGGEVKLLEHTNAFAVFAREGIYHPISAILKVEDKNGNILEEFQEDEKKVLSSDSARMINDILSDNNARAYTFGLDSWLTLGDRPVAAKTGTTNDYRDAWTIGYTPSIVAGVWVGNNDNSEMKRGAAGGRVAAPIWHNFMQRVLGDTPVESFKKLSAEEMKTGKPILDGEVGSPIKVEIDRASGLLATEFTPKNFIEVKEFQENHSILYYVDKKDPRGDAPDNPSKDPQYDLWESRVLAWAEEEGLASSTPPTEYDNLHKVENRPEFEILAPSNNSLVDHIFLNARVKASAPRGINRVEYYIDDKLFYQNYSYPFDMEGQIGFLDNGFHNLGIRVCDDIDNCSYRSVEFNLVLSDEDRAGNSSQIDLSWVSPGSGLALNRIDFPLNLEFDIQNPDQAAKVEVFVKKETGDEKVADLEPINSDKVSGVWRNPPEPGEYTLYGILKGWRGQEERSGEIVVVVN